MVLIFPARSKLLARHWGLYPQRQPQQASNLRKCRPEGGRFQIPAV
ncbi:MAG: hypothetical protein ACREV3_10565 [Gammaproteobacteria bacterium]